MSDQPKDEQATTDDADVEGHKFASPDLEGDDDVEGHKFASPDLEGDDDVEGHKYV